MDILKKPYWIAAGVVALVCVLFVAYCMYTLVGRPVYFRVVTDDGPALSEPMEGWIAGKENKKNIHIYSFQSTDLYELLLVDNRYAEKNLYLSSTIQAKLVSGVLKVNITDQPASDETDVQYNTKAYFILTKKPENIEVYVNDQKYTFELEVGERQITD